MLTISYNIWTVFEGRDQLAEETHPVSTPSYTTRQLRTSEATTLVRGTQCIHGGAAALGIPVIDVCPTIEVYRGLWNWIYLPIESINEVSPVSMDWFKANFTGNPISSGKNTMVSGYCFPINQSIDNNNPSPIETSWKFIKLGIPLATGWLKRPSAMDSFHVMVYSTRFTTIPYW